MENQNSYLNSIFLDHFHYDNKDKYEWNIISVSKDPENKRCVFYGINKANSNDYIYIKQIKINLNQNNNKEIVNILREIYFLVLLKNQKYIVQLDDILLDSETNCNHLFLIFKGSSVSLNKLINYQGNDYLSNRELVKWIVYQITFALYILHNNNIIHNDIKPSNILINEIGGIAICDFGSACFKDEDSYSYTRYYSSPEFLNDTLLKRDEKSDIWGLGVIIIELLLKTNIFIFN
jgi:serine/threonine protein kinase